MLIGGGGRDGMGLGRRWPDERSVTWSNSERLF